MSDQEARREEELLLTALRRRDEEAFMTLVERHTPAMTRVARMYVPAAVAGDVVQEAWIGVLLGVDQFEGRSSLKTWLLMITANQAQRWAARQRQDVPASELSADVDGDPTPAVPPDRFLDGRWSTLPVPWDIPDDRLLAGELREMIEEVVAALPLRQREVITLHDLEGVPAAEVAYMLGITLNHQRVLLHRARAAVRSQPSSATLSTHRRGLVCQDVVELASDHIDGQLAPPAESAVVEHLATCAGCRTYVEQLRTTVAVLSRLPGPEHDALPAVREAFRAHGNE